MAGTKQAGSTDDNSGTAPKDGQRGAKIVTVPAVPEPIFFPDTLPMPAPTEQPAPDDEKPKG